MECDVIVIGSGQAGVPLAARLAEAGRRVVLAERAHLGGTCVNYGCTPTKTMVAHARVAHVVRRAAEYGVHGGNDVRVDLRTVVNRKNEMVSSSRQGQEEHAASRDTLDLYRAHARFTGVGKVDAGGETLESERIFIDTGMRALIPPIPGVEEIDVLTNRTIMELTEVPEHLIVLGGSYIGLEFGQMFRRFGSRVTIIERANRIIVREDPEVSDALQSILEEEKIRFITDAEVANVGRQAGGVTVSVSTADGKAQTLEGTHLLAAVGRVPNTDDLGLEKAGIETDDRGRIVVNDRLETTAPGVWAIGDVKGGPAFTHISYDDHLIIYDNLIEGADRSIRERVVPYALFTDPELGRVGMTERQARDAGLRLKVGCIPMSRVARAQERGQTEGLMKVVIDADTDQIVGGAVLGPEGGEVIHVLMTLMWTKAPWTMLRNAVYIHPTLAEGFFSLMGSVSDA